jgi:hypothetical protein
MSTVRLSEYAQSLEARESEDVYGNGGFEEYRRRVERRTEMKADMANLKVDEEKECGV